MKGKIDVVAEKKFTHKDTTSDRMNHDFENNLVLEGRRFSGYINGKKITIQNKIEVNVNYEQEKKDADKLISAGISNLWGVFATEKPNDNIFEKF